MHTYIPQDDGWVAEYLRDDSDATPPKNIEGVLLNGCSFIEESRKSEHYVAVVRYEEHSRRNITVEGIVWHMNGTTHHHKSLEDAVFLEKEEFELPGSELSDRQKAYAYAKELKDKITGKYFP